MVKTCYSAERYKDSDVQPPAIRVVVAKAAKTCIKISDEGGGIPRSGLKKFDGVYTGPLITLVRHGI